MSRFLIGVVIERTQSVDLLFEVEADDLSDAKTQAILKANEVGDKAILAATAYLDWDADGDLYVGGISDVDYNDGKSYPDFPVAVSK